MAETFETRNAYAEFLRSKEWDYFSTVTCRNPRVDTLAFIRDYTTIAATSWTSQMRGFVAVEPHQTGMLHIHGLLAYTQMFNADGRPLFHPAPDALQSKFDRVFGRSRIVCINSHAAVSAYCAKYVTKATNRGYEYDFIGNW